MRALLPFLSLLCFAAAAAPGATAAAAPPVTAQNLLANERLWPYHVALVRAWSPPGARQPLPAGTRGVLIRVERDGLARVDFGRDGLFEIPVDATDLVAQAERVRRGELYKTAPNFALAIGPRLLDPEGESVRPFDFAQSAQKRGFLAVFADPDQAGFAALASALASLRGRDGVQTILFPQGQHPDARVAERLRSLGFRVPFVTDRMSEAYTRSLLPDPAVLPAVSLQTSEGRLLYLAAWSEDCMPALTRALAEGFSEPTSR